MPFGHFPKPKTPLGYYRLLAPSAGVRVSPLCLGAMNFGDAWAKNMGEQPKEVTFEILDYFYENGGNFIDTANGYQEGESESRIGEWMAARKNRDEMVIATKYTTFYKETDPSVKIRANYQGNHIKSMNLSLEDSLKKMQTSYVDILYVHWWDVSTSVEEMMQGLNRLVAAGKVLYLGASDMPAWVVMKANCYARQHGLAPFVVYQGRYSCSQRDCEREIMPMIADQGMGFCAYGTLGSGNFKTKEQREAMKGEGRNFLTKADDKAVAMTAKLEELAKTKNTKITSVAMAYAIQKAPYVFPLVGTRKLEHLKDAVEALKVKLTAEDIAEIEGAALFEPGFPFSLVFQHFDPKAPYHSGMTTEDIGLVRVAAHIDSVRPPQPIEPHS